MENKKKFSKTSLALIIAFLSIIVFLTAWNADRFVWMMQKDLPGITPNNAIWRTGSWNTSFTEYFRFKWILVDTYGIFNLGIGKQSLDNFALIKDENGIMQKTQENFEKQEAIESIVAISDAFKERQIPVVFVSQPSRFTEESFPLSNEINFFGARDREYLSALSEGGVDILEAEASGPVALKTDMHLTTRAELDIAHQIANRLIDMGIDYRNSDIIFDLGNYDSVTYPFYGNLVKSAGRYFTFGGDDFELLYPRFETDLTMENLESGTVKSGDFRDSIMNGMEDNLEITREPYWVLDYLAYPSAMCTVTNNMQEDGCNILFVMDSVAMRTASYLALGAWKITVIDPRGENGTELLIEEMKNGDYDAVIIECGGEEFYFAINFNDYDLSNQG